MHVYEVKYTKWHTEPLSKPPTDDDLVQFYSLIKHYKTNYTNGLITRSRENIYGLMHNYFIENLENVIASLSVSHDDKHTTLMRKLSWNTRWQCMKIKNGNRSHHLN